MEYNARLFSEIQFKRDYHTDCVKQPTGKYGITCKVSNYAFPGLRVDLGFTDCFRVLASFSGFRVSRF